MAPHYTSETLLSIIINNPGISYRDFEEELGIDREAWSTFHKAFDMLRFTKKIFIVRFTCWVARAKTDFRYYAAEYGSIEVVDIDDNCSLALEYDPHGTKEAARLANV